MEIDFEDEIKICRKKFNGLMSTITKFVFPEGIYIPRWVNQDPYKPYLEISKYQNELFSRGQIVWASIVQANSLLFSHGKENHPAIIIYSEYEEFDNSPISLLDSATSIYETKNKAYDDTECQSISNIISDEDSPIFKKAIPSSITNKSELFCSAIMIDRKHLPNQMLSKPIFPILILPEISPISIVLPSKYWSNKLIQYWSAEISADN